MGKPLYSTGNKPIYSTGNKPVYAYDFTIGNKLYVKLSFTTIDDSEAVIPCGSCYSTDDCQMNFGPRIGVDFTRISTLRWYPDYFLFPPLNPPPASGYDGAMDGIMTLDFVNANRSGGWAWSQNSWAILIYAWRFRYTHFFEPRTTYYVNGNQVLIEAAVKNPDMTATIATDDLTAVVQTFDGDIVDDQYPPFTLYPLAVVRWRPLVGELTVSPYSS